MFGYASHPFGDVILSILFSFPLLGKSTTNFRHSKRRRILGLRPTFKGGVFGCASHPSGDVILSIHFFPHFGTKVQLGNYGIQIPKNGTAIPIIAYMNVPLPTPQLRVRTNRTKTMVVGDRVRVSPDLTHFADWVMGQVTDIENNPFVGIVITAELEDGNVFFGYEYLFEKI